MELLLRHFGQDGVHILMAVEGKKMRVEKNWGMKYGPATLYRQPRRFPYNLKKMVIVKELNLKIDFKL